MQIPSGYSAKVLGALAQAGILASRRGPNGGFTLARDPERVSVLEVVNAVDPIRRITQCPLGLAAHRRELCPLHRRLDGAAAALESTLRSSRISELIGDLADVTARATPAPARATRGHSLPVVREPEAAAGRRGRRARG